jgi:hypothetical protein
MPRSLVVLLLASLTLAPYAQEASVTVDAGTRVVLGQQDQITSKLFGVTAFEGFSQVVSDADYQARLAALRPGAIRLPGVVSWISPPAFDPGYFESPEAQDLFEHCMLYGDRYPLGRFGPVARHMGADVMVSLGGTPSYLAYEGSNRPADFDRWAQYCAGYVALWKRFDPELRLVQVWNEPNADWWKDPRASQPGATEATLHIAMANRVSGAIKARFPDVQVGGPVLCWPPGWPPDKLGDDHWWTWKRWTLPWLEGTRDTVDFYDFHVYDVPADDFAVQTEMLVNAAWRIQGRRLPVWVTESGVTLAEGELNDAAASWTQRVLPYERLLLRGMLPQADKLAGNLMHDLHARLFSLLPADADHPAPIYWLLWVLRDLRGRRIVADASDPDLVSFATVEDDRTTLVLFNDSPRARKVNVAATLPSGWWTGPEVRAIGEGPDGGLARLDVACALEHQAPGAVGTVDLPARATVSINLRSAWWPHPEATRAISEHFGDQNVVMLSPDAPVVVHIPVPDLGDGTAMLRLGLLGPEAGDQVRVRFNGEALPVRPVAVQEVAVEATRVRANNTVEVSLGAPTQNAKLALGFASVVVRREE